MNSSISEKAVNYSRWEQKTMLRLETYIRNHMKTVPNTAYTISNFTGIILNISERVLRLKKISKNSSARELLLTTLKLRFSDYELVVYEDSNTIVIKENLYTTTL